MQSYLRYSMCLLRDTSHAKLPMGVPTKNNVAMLSLLNHFNFRCLENVLFRILSLTHRI